MYRGNRFRSRLEARWASFFDLIEWPWTYEPLDGAGYVPDFLVTGHRSMLVEIKPAADTTQLMTQAWAKAEAGLSGLWPGDVLLLGATPLPHLLTNRYGWDDDKPCAGVLAEYHPAQTGSQWATVPAQWHTADARWITCRMCNAPAVIHAELSYRARPCGHYDGDGHLGALRSRRLEDWWALAGVSVQWKAPA